MGYTMHIDQEKYHIVNESQTHHCDDSGFSIWIQNIFLEHIHLKWGQYQSPESKSYSVSPNDSNIVSHFCLSGGCITEGNKMLSVNSGEYILFEEEATEFQYEMLTDNNKGAFFEMSIDKDYYTQQFVGENTVFDTIIENQALLQGSIGKDCRIQNLLAELNFNKDVYTGKLKHLYLEAKVTELLLCQSKHSFMQSAKINSKLNYSDIEALHHAKQILDSSISIGKTITTLALEVGVNQTKLKTGFKEVFNCTIFEYLTQLRMIRSQQLLKEGKLSIYEIANEVGYQHSQHFAQAYKRYFGYLPSQTK